MLSEAEVARDIYQVEEARPSRRAGAPRELALERIVKNKTSSPCSLPEFMDYLVCSEENAEMLQFFTWFCDYVAHFSNLSAQEILLSPPWKPASRGHGRGGSSGSVPAVQTHRRGGSDRLERILEIMDKQNARDALHRVSDQGHKKVNSDPLNFSTPRRLSGTEYSQLQLAQGQKSNSTSTNQQSPGEVDVSRYAQQPCRQEIDQVVQQYIRGDAPRRLKISAEDLAGCLDAVKVTTHPSAMMPAFIACETILKSRSHPAFVRMSQRNANRPRLIFVRAVATFIILIGFGLSLALIMGSFSKTYRVVSLILWWPSSTILFASSQGICLFLHLRNLRQLRPWEHSRDIEAFTQDVGKDEDVDDDNLSGYKGKMHTNPAGEYQNDKSSTRSTPSSHMSSRSSVRRLATTKTPIMTDSIASMQTFGGANKLVCETKWAAWQRRSMAKRIWDERVRVESRPIRLLQDRTVLMAVCLGGAVSAFLTVGSLWLPDGDLL